jgi:hypothetical protein
MNMANGFPPTIVVIEAGDRLLLLDRSPAIDAEYEAYLLPREAFGDDRLERRELFTQGTLLGRLAMSHLEIDESQRLVRASSIQTFLSGDIPAR